MAFHFVFFFVHVCCQASLFDLAEDCACGRERLGSLPSPPISFGFRRRFFSGCVVNRVGAVLAARMLANEVFFVQ